jgi:hypothetical protein
MRGDMLAGTASLAPWYVVNADDKKRTRLNCISQLAQSDSVKNFLGLILCKEIKREAIKLREAQRPHG